MGEIADRACTVKRENAALNRLDKSNTYDDDKRAIRDFILSIQGKRNSQRKEL
jgi:hypothetical protein